MGMLVLKHAISLVQSHWTLRWSLAPNYCTKHTQTLGGCEEDVAHLVIVLDDQL
jgi:hypothetical protein